MQLVDTKRRVSRSRSRTLADRAGRLSTGPCVVESLEPRQLLALSGVALGPLPLGFFDATGQTSYHAETNAFDIVATPTSLILPPGLSVDLATLGQHGDAQVHIKVDSSGNLIRGVTPADSPSIGGIDAAGNDFVIRGSGDLDGNGTIEASETNVLLLTGEVYAFGFLDTGSTNDFYDFRFVATGGLLASYFPAGTDIGLIVTSEASDFNGSFESDFSGAAKGAYGPIAAPAPSSLSGTIYCDHDLSGSLTGADMGIANVAVTLTGVNDAGQNVVMNTFTASDGTYSFILLRPGTYAISEVSPPDTIEGTNTVGTAGGIVVNEDAIAFIAIAGVNGTGYNFGYICLANISGTKFKDVAGDGFSPSDPGLGGTTIYIDANNNNTLDPGEKSTSTAPDGTYSFTGLTPGNYTIREVVPAGYYKTAPADGYVVTLAPGDTAAGNNFANALFGKITGTKYKDITGNGVSSDDTGLSGTVIYIDANNNGSLDPGERSTTSGSNGSFTFDNLTAGDYVIREVVPAGYVRTTPVAPIDRYVVTLSPGQTAGGNNFANTQKGKITGKKYKDLTGNGITSDDTALSGVTVFIDANNNGNLDSGEASTTTGADGSFTFDNLMPGTYTVREVVPGGYYATAPASGKYAVTLTTGETESGKNFANAQFGKLTGKKYKDTTGNGYSADDTGFSGVVIYLDADNDGNLDNGERSTTTGADGSYAFDNLTPGTYIVREVVPTGFIRTGPVLVDYYSQSVANGQTAAGLNFTNAEKCDLDDICNVQFSINGCDYVTDLRGNTQQGDVVTVTFTIKAGHEPHRFTLVSYTAPSPEWDASVADQQRIFDSDTGLFGPGTYQLTVTIPDCYYQIDFVCGAAIDKLGPDGSNIFYTPQMRLVSADNGGKDACIAKAASICGLVWLDDDNDGVFDASEMPIEGAKITLSWTASGVTKTITRYTDVDGQYCIGNLKSGVTYKVAETQPSGYADGKDKLGSAGGTLGNDYVSGITFGASVNAINYNFGERNLGDAVSKKDTAAVSFWVSTAGQNLIKSLNGGSGAEELGMWLGDRFPRLFGDSAGTFNLKGKTNAQIASSMIARNTTATNLEAQVLATALSVYVTNSAWAGGSMAASYGFTVNLAGSGLSLYSTGTNGTALGLANNSSQTLLASLAGANAAASGNGIIYNGNTTTRTNLFNYFKAINGAGGIV